MKKPNSLMQLISYIFLILGPMFIVAGYLNAIGLLATSPNSKGDPAIVFPILGIIIFIFGNTFFFIPWYHQKKRKKLKENGVKIQGTVTKIKLLSYTRWGNQSPYIVSFKYMINDKEYKGKSALLWEKPELCIGDKITVYVKKNYSFADLDIYYGLSFSESRK